MNKIFTLAIATTLALGASAADVHVYDNGTLANGLEPNHWWNATWNLADSHASAPGEQLLSFKATDGGANASMGIVCNRNVFPVGPLHSSTLHFSWYTEGTGKYIIRLTQPEQDYSFTVSPETTGKWNTVALNLAEAYPAVSENWRTDNLNGNPFVFSIVLENGSENNIIYFKDIYFSDIDETWTAPVKPETPKPSTVPVPTQKAENVVSLFSDSYPAATTFGIGGWGQATQAEVMEIDGKHVYALKYFNYLGWEFAQHLDVTNCKYMHVDFWTPDGTTFGFTPISPGAEKAWVAPQVKQNEWNSYDVELTHWDNVNFTDLFQVKFDQGNGQTTGYIANVYFYGESANAPTLTAEATDITFNSANITYNVTLPDEIAGADYKVFYTLGEGIDTEAAASPIALTGLTENTTYNMQLWAVATKDGETFESSKVKVTFKTPRENPDAEAHWYGNINGTVNNNPYQISYEFIATPEGNLTINATFDDTTWEIPGFVPKVFAQTGVRDMTVERPSATVTTPDAFNEGDMLTIRFYCPFAGGLLETENILYTFGESNQKPVVTPTPIVAAKAQNVAMTSAEIAYTITFPMGAEADSYVVKYSLDGAEEAEAAESPIALTGLTAGTEYTCQVWAVATKGTETFTSEKAGVTFTTIAEGAEAKTYHKIIDTYLPNARYFNPADEGVEAKREVPVQILATVTHNLDKTITVDMEYVTAHPIVGIVTPRLKMVDTDHAGQGKQPENAEMTQVEGTKYTYTSEADPDKVYADNANVAYFEFQFVYADGGAANIPFGGYNAGQENDPVTVGDAASIRFTAPSVAHAGTQETYSVIAVDENNHFVFESPVEVTSGTIDFNEDGRHFIATTRGDAKVTATCGELTADFTLTVLSETTTLATEATVTASETAENPANIMNGNHDDVCFWPCTDTQNHWFEIDLGAAVFVELLHLDWEGAKATDYTVTMSKDPISAAPATSSAMRVAAPTLKVFEITDEAGQGGTDHIYSKIANPGYQPVEARYIRIETTKAHDAGWGIKLHEAQVYASPQDTTGIESVTGDDTDAPVEYYNLQGVRVDNPAAGHIYIRRQGNTATKVAIR